MVSILFLDFVCCVNCPWYCGIYIVFLLEHIATWILSLIAIFLFFPPQHFTLPLSSTSSLKRKENFIVGISHLEIRVWRLYLEWPYCYDNFSLKVSKVGGCPFLLSQDFTDVYLSETWKLQNLQNHLMIVLKRISILSLYLV